MWEKFLKKIQPGWNMKEEKFDNSKEVMTLQEAAKCLGLSKRTLYRYMQDKIFARIIKYPGGRVRLYLEDVLQFRNKCEVSP